MEVKSNSVELSTFLKYGLTDVIGHKTLEKEGKTMVNFIWCKVCAKFNNQIINSLSVKGSAKTSTLAFISGRNSVTKLQEFIFNYFFSCF